GWQRLKSLFITFCNKKGLRYDMGQKGHFSADCVVFGGGIAGLWALACLRDAGYQAVLLEADRLGAGQTVGSQGIIHSGLKYALLGQVNQTAKRIAEVAYTWRAAMADKSFINLSSVQVTSPQQYLLVPNKFLATFGSVLSSFGDGVSV